MPRFELELSDYKRLFRRRYKLVIAITIIVTGFAIPFALIKPAQFTATSFITIDRNDTWSPDANGDGSAIYGEWDNIATQVREVSSYPVLIRAAKWLALVPDSISENSLVADEKILKLLDGLAAQIKVEAPPDANTISITASSSDAGEAHQLANAVATAYREFSFYQKKLHVERTGVIIRKQLDSCAADLRRIETAMLRFEKESMAPTDEAQLNLLMDRRTSLTVELKEIGIEIQSIVLQKENLVRRRASKAAIDSNSSQSRRSMAWVSPPTDKDPGLTALVNRLTGQQLDLENRLAHYTRKHPSVQALEASIDKTIDDLILDYDKKRSRLRMRETELTDQRASLDRQLRKLPATKTAYARLRRDYKTSQELFAALSARMQTIQITAAAMNQDVNISRLAQLPGKSGENKVSRVAGIGLLLGFLLGIIGAIIREIADTSISSVEDVERALVIPVVGVIPHIKPAGRSGLFKKQPSVADTDRDPRGWLPIHFSPLEQAAEAFRILRTNLEASLVSKSSCRVFLVTSAAMSEGKSFTSANLAIAFAQVGRKVLLLEGDMRLPTLERSFGLVQGSNGLADILDGGCMWRDCRLSVADFALGKLSLGDVTALPGLDNLTVIPSGKRPRNPSELASSARMREIVAEMRTEFNIIFIDAPPLLPVADTLILGNLVDEVIMVYRTGQTPRNAVRLCVERLAAHQFPVAGLVLNDMRPENTEQKNYI
jgi:capsular exopolysaccharide synthesis family protein